jgi:hypothetical protein
MANKEEKDGDWTKGDELESIDLHKIFSGPNEEKKDEHNVPKEKSIILLLIFSIITLGIYNAFWYSKRRSEFSNLGTKKKLPKFLAMLYLMISFAAVFSGIIFTLSLSPEKMGTFYQNTSTLQTILIIVFLAGSILQFILSLFLAFISRGIINEAIKFNKNTQKTISGILTFIFGIFYLQYEINRVVNDKEGESVRAPWIFLILFIIAIVVGLLFLGII